MKEKSPIEKNAERKQIDLAFRSLERSLERKRVLAERIRQRLSQVPSARRVRQSVQCPFHGFALGQERLRVKSFHSL